MKSENLNVVLLQLTSTDDESENLKQIVSYLKNPQIDGADLVCLPENSFYMRIQEGEPIQGFSLNSKIFKTLSDYARQLNVMIHTGSNPLWVDNCLFNSSVILKPSGEIIESYRKIHLFDVDVDNHFSVRESDVFSAGESISIFECKGWKIGQAICYDLRFAELFYQYSLQDWDVMLLPAAFLVPTGLAHWETLIRTRCIENQVYGLAVAQAGEHRGRQGAVRHTYGHSMVVDPWGKIIHEAGGETQILKATLDKKRVEEVRRQIPMKNHRKIIKNSFQGIHLS